MILRPAPALPEYAELHCLSNFSFLRGASHPEELVRRCVALDYRALALTDECSVAGVVRAHAEIGKLRESGGALKLIIGSEFALDDGARIVLLAADREGYGHLCRTITEARGRAVKGSYKLDWRHLDAPHCLALLISPHPTPAQAGKLTEHFEGRAWISAELFNGADDGRRLAELRALAAATGLPLACSGDVHMHVRSRQALQDTLTAIRLKTNLAGARHALFPNAERHLRQRSHLSRLYGGDLLQETLKIAARCTFDLGELKYEYPDEIVPAGHSAVTYLRERVEAGLKWRYPQGESPAIRRTVEEELALIAELRYEPYFLTVYDVVRFAREQGILCQGRGSAANSIVCYCLGITSVNPAESRLLFGRFLSRERNEPPDIDVDFEHERREEVIQYIYGKYGRERAAIAAVVISYRPKSVIRDVGKALGLDPVVVDGLAKSLAWWDNRKELALRLAEHGLDPGNPTLARFLVLADRLVGFPRHLSQHPSGFVISRGPLCGLVPVENAAMPERSVIQWDKDDLESLGLLKVDILALGMLTVIRRALAFCAERGGPGELDEIPRGDKPTYAMIQRADTVGVFQIESRAQMSMLPRLKPANFYDLVIEVSIVRPGPIQGDMVHPYLKRRQGLEKIEYPGPEVEEVLERTLGVPIFQEQVMELAIKAAGFTAGEADDLRRSMAAWRRRGKMDYYQEKLRKGLAERGYPEKFIAQIAKQVMGFGEYGFPESHAASFAKLAYASAWLKCHHPAIFLAALLNSQPMGFYAPSQLVQDARRHGVIVRPVDVLHSDWDCTLEAAGENTWAVRLGLCLASGMAKDAVSRIMAARPAYGRPHTVAELARQARLSKKDLRCLAECGALKELAGHRREAHWKAAGAEPLPGLLAASAIHDEQPVLPAPLEGEDIVADYTSLGLTLERHPMALLRPHLSRRRWMGSAALSKVPHGRSVRVAGIVTGRQRPQTASGTVFVTLEDESGNINVLVWPSLVESQRQTLLGARLLAVQGMLERSEGVTHLIAHTLEDLTPLLGSLPTASRDFH